MIIRDLDKAIKSLNARSNVSAIDPDRLAEFALSAEEEDLIKTHKPYRALIVYGTPAPGKPYYKVVEHIEGQWKKATFKGRLENKGWGADPGFFGYTPADDDQSVIDCQVLISDSLTASWALLDDFEGDGYKRILARYELTDGDIGVGYIYALAED